ncbi:hypothetical protein BT69DRAFT_1298288 [Atractiella rhizophila]|nr:hypothetical protein BT69DRAFT_1298288 [Atractiella rhizophila]
MMIPLLLLSFDLFTLALAQIFDPSASSVLFAAWCNPYEVGTSPSPSTFNQAIGLYFFPRSLSLSHGRAEKKKKKKKKKKQADALRKHLEYEVAQYGDQHLINLVDHKGHELPIKFSFERAIEVAGHPRVHYRYFDFHTHTKGLRFDRVSLLLDEIGEDLIQQGYFFRDGTVGSSSQRTQSSVCRTNCMDCLDRTNVVQSTIARWMLNRQLREIGVLKANEVIEDQPQFMNWFRNLWADNADVISTTYSGTGALKTDFTRLKSHRTGKRTVWGNIQDGNNSVQRYLKNNYFDGPRQDAFDLITGNWVAGRGPGWMKDRRPIQIQILKPTHFDECAVVGTILYIPIAKILWLIAGILTFQFIWANGIQYVAWPRLVPLDYNIEYDKKRPLPKHTNVIAQKGIRTQSVEIELGHKQRVD